ncbi:TonB-dependent receptor [Prosthecochloris sp. ZM_2]|uniref:TonB-dependent receptor plug domain-containing protein n=1 Tax=Prosthecochloris sp. ZM_2 TaxID=2045206 RepID=UPI000DF735F9|nr:TonB-dependent receptor [Prosthecochloris sp. ZM_2]RNA64849.1 TonB-dependent receptor [Prosthecochloris sp. ZM_2]
MKKKRFLVFLAAGLLASGVVKAEDLADSTRAKNYFSQELVVTATKTLNSVSDAGGSSVTVITEEEIERSGQQTVEEVIKGTTGIDVASNGGIGTSSSVFIRGADSKNTLLLVDGVPLNDPSSANRNPVFDHLTIDNIERIEVVRGPVSALYGTNATAGVINVITKKGTADPEVHVGVEGGSYGTWKAYGGARGADGGFDYSVNVSRLETDGFSIANEDNDQIPHAGNTSENDGYENTSGSVNLGYQFNDNIRLDGVLRYTDSSVETDDFGPGYAGDRFGDWPGYLPEPDLAKEQRTDSEQWSGRIALKMDYDPVVSSVFYNFSDQEREIYSSDGDKTNDYDGALYEFGWQGDFAIFEGNLMTVGLNYNHESVDNVSYGMYGSVLEDEVATVSGFVQDQWKIGDLNLVGAVRYEDHDLFGDKTTWRVAPSYTYDDVMFKFSYGTGFRAPSLFELYSSYGNPDLQPETSKGWDAGFEKRFSDRFRAGATYFRSDYEDRIEFDMLTYTYQQAEGLTKTYGVETFFEWAASEDVFFTANYTWTETEDPDGNELVRRPRHKFGLTGSWDVTDKARLAANMQWVGDRKAYSGAMDKDGNPVEELDSYVLVNLTGSYQVTENIELYGRVDNLLDEFYEEAWSYATPGLSAYGGIRLTY